jgi:hypothetical protein
MSHEQSITIRNKKSKKWVNIKGLVDGKFAPKKAEALYHNGKRKPLDGTSYGSIKEAVSAAKRRSAGFNKK